jgi:hypothetical protein
MIPRGDGAPTSVPPKGGLTGKVAARLATILLHCKMMEGAPDDRSCSNADGERARGRSGAKTAAVAKIGEALAKQWLANLLANCNYGLL